MFITISCDNRIFWDEYAKIEYNLRGEIISEVAFKFLSNFSHNFYTFVQSLTIAIVSELIYYTNGHSRV